MGINPTPTNYKALSFDGVSSRSYGVYITGEGVFDAPKRSIEMVEIAGRNGAYAVDNGNFQNIEVKYPAAIVADTEADFADAIADFRSFLCSKYSYCRLEDEYNPNEYRMAIFKNGFEVSHDGLLTGEFDLVFDCQPQRFLTSGETPISVISGDDVTNPTPFPARPMLEVYGYGEINFGNNIISIESRLIGRTQLSRNTNANNVALDMSMMNNGDAFTVNGAKGTLHIQLAEGYTFTGKTTVGSLNRCTASIEAQTTNSLNVVITADSESFVNGTNKAFTPSATLSMHVENNGVTTSLSVGTGLNIIYSKTTNKLSVSTVALGSSPEFTWTKSQYIPDIWGNSTKSALGSPMYIDLDLGECYNTDYGTAVSVNDAVSLPAVLPTLPSGNTEITYDNTITQLDIVPRWWVV